MGFVNFLLQKAGAPIKNFIYPKLSDNAIKMTNYLMRHGINTSRLLDMFLQRLKADKFPSLEAGIDFMAKNVSLMDEGMNVNPPKIIPIKKHRRNKKRLEFKNVI